MRRTSYRRIEINNVIISYFSILRNQILLISFLINNNHNS